MGPAEDELTSLRDALVRDLRQLAYGAPDALPEDVALKGILGRVDPLLAAQAPHIDALAGLDLLGSADEDAQDLVFEVLTRVLHVPRMVMALGEVLRQDTKSEALRPLQQEAARAAARIQLLARLWALRQAGLDPDALDDLEDDLEDEGLEDEDLEDEGLEDEDGVVER